MASKLRRDEGWKRIFSTEEWYGRETWISRNQNSERSPNTFLIESFGAYRLTLFFFKCMKSIIRKMKPAGTRLDYMLKIHQNSNVFCYPQITSTKGLFLEASFIEMKKSVVNWRFIYIYSKPLCKSVRFRSFSGMLLQHFDWIRIFTR